VADEITKDASSDDSWNSAISLANCYHGDWDMLSDLSYSNSVVTLLALFPGCLGGEKVAWYPVFVCVYSQKTLESKCIHL